MKPTPWMHELHEIKKISEECIIENSGLLKELESLAGAQDEVVTLLYSRRALEVIVTELCLEKLCRERGTEPLKSVIDKFYKDKAVPDYIAASMQNLNSISNFGAHPKEFDPRQVRSNLIELITILDWYFKEKKYKPNKKASPPRIETEKKVEVKEKSIITKEIMPVNRANNNLIIKIGIAVFVIVVLSIFVFKYLQKTDNKIISSQIERDTIASAKINENKSVQTDSIINASEKVTPILTKPVIDYKKETTAKKDEIKSNEKVDLDKVLKEVTNDKLSFTARKNASVKMKTLFEKNAVISICLDSVVVDRFSIDDYLNRLLTLSGLQVTITNLEKNRSSKITKMSVTENKNGK